jgi:endonuclease III
MRTSKLSQDTTRIFNAISSNARSSTRRSTRSSKLISTFSLGHDGTVDIKEEERSPSPASSSAVADIEDAVAPATPPASSRKRKRKESISTPANLIASRVKIEATSPSLEPVPVTDHARQKAKPKIPAKRKAQPDGSYIYTPPSNWDEIYSIVKAQRERSPVAPVDTMGCEDLFWQNAPPKQQRYHTLVALMLSSQTKDTVTAAAMFRLHTELAPQGPLDAQGRPTSSSLTVQNMIDSDPKHLDSLIGKVGFHNNKTRYLKATAQVLLDQHDGDVPNTLEGLVALPGVGPKMAFLCLSGAWGIDDGIGVDVHVHRITNLWGWHTTKNPEETRMWLEGWLPKDKWHEINKLLVGLGQLVCLPVGRRCGECDLQGTGLCKAEVRGWKASPRKLKVEEQKVVVKYEGMGGERTLDSKQIKGES